MKRLVTNLFIYSILACCLYLDEFFSIKYAGNLAIFASWFFIVTGFTALFVDSEKMFADFLPKAMRISKSAQYFTIGFMIIIGWTVTGVFYLIAAILMHLKYSIYRNALSEFKQA